MTTRRFLLKAALIMAAFIVSEGSFFTDSISLATVNIIDPPHWKMAGIASYYSYECAYQPMANGRMFDPQKRTCASWFHRLGTLLVVKSLDSGLSTEVVVTDRGPNKRLVRQGRIIDLSERSFRDIYDPEKGLTRVVVTLKSRAGSR